MDTHSSTLRLRLPTPEHNHLSFCKPSVRDFKLWIENLPKANIGETARLLYQALQELNAFKTPAENRVQLLELLRPEVLFINTQLEKHFTNSAVMLDARSQKVANLCQAIQNHLTNGYKLVIAGSLENGNPVLPLALQRALHSMFASLVRACQLYYPAPAHLWFELHQLYALARRHKLHTQAVGDTLLPQITEQSVEAAYSCALLLSCARINQMRKNDIALLAKTLPGWSQLATLQSAELPSSLFVLNLNSDAPPRYKTLISHNQSPAWLGFSTQELAAALLAQQQSLDGGQRKAQIAVPDSMSSTLITQLHSAWGNIAKRNFQRTSGQGALEVCIGMSAVHYYLSEQTSFADTLKINQAQPIEYKTDNSPPDIWASAIDAELDTVFDPLQADLIEYTPEADDSDAPSKAFPNNTPSLYPLFSLEVVNQSPGGYCLAWHDSMPPLLQTGEILALRDSLEKPWFTAVVSWIRQINTTTTHMGIELLAPNAQYCGLQLRDKKKSSQYLRALLVPEIAALSRPASVIAPRVPFQEGHKVAINLQGEALKAVLNKSIKQTSSINQFEYRLLTPAKDTTLANQPATSSTTAELSLSDDFDSLWKSL